MPDAANLDQYARLLRLTPVDGTPQASAAIEVKAEASQERRFSAYALGSLLLFVVLPMLIGMAYFGWIAADRYESEARFVIRIPGMAGSAGVLANLMQKAGEGLPTAGMVRGAEDSYIVSNYLESRDALAYIETHAAYRKMLESEAADFLWRFPNFFTANTQEGLYRHYRRLMSISFDSTTGVSTLRVEAFTPGDAQRLATSLLKGAEALINRLNDRARRDAIGFAEAEVDRMRRRADDAQAKLTMFRERENLVDPTHSTLAILEAIARLSEEVALVNVHLRELQSGSPAGPQISSLRNRQAALEAQITSERQKLAGDVLSIAPRIAEYERLVLEREFSHRALLAALTAVEMARLEAMRQQVYIEQVAAPSLPDRAAYPWRVLWCLGILLFSYVVFRIGCLLLNDARRHVDP
jgi:capsular polysaccharide transport system permease protein